MLTPTDRRGTPLFWTDVLPYGEVRLDMTSRLAFSAPGRTQVLVHRFPADPELLRQRRLRLTGPAGSARQPEQQ
jgi:hypothetical protein